MSLKFKQAVSCLRYAGPLARAVVLWKYENHRYLSDVLALLMVDWAADSAPKWFDSIQAVVPAPQHPKTLDRRGFSPPEELASRLACAFSLPYLPRVLYKIRETEPQARLSRDARTSNIKDSMMVFDSSLVDGKTILVVDDVMTTGATVNECARALRISGAASVYCLTLARQADCA